MKYLLGIDFGGGASKATLIDTEGTIVAEHSVEYPTLHPNSGWCEQRPEDWYAALCEDTKELLGKSGVDAADILAIAIDSATHTAVLCDKDAKPLRPAIHWTDTRSVKQSNDLKATDCEYIEQKTFAKPGTIWTLPQIVWVRENEPEVFDKIGKIFFEKDYLRYMLTDVYCTDFIEAQGSMLFDNEAMCWDDKLCQLAGIDKAIMPPIVKPTDIIGKVTEKAANETGLKADTPVICGTTDTVMEVFASGAVEKGQMTVKLATAGRICVITDKAYPHPYLINYAHIVDGMWYPGTATKAAASSYRWYRDTFGGDYKELDQGAAECSMGADGLMFHPYINGELTPYADPLLCGSFIGIRAEHTKAHFTRAVLEGVSLSLLDNMLALNELNIPHNNHATLIGGGAKGTLWRQITADMLGITLKITESSDSSLGSAMLAGIAVGVFKDAVEAVKKCIKVKAVVEPNPENTAKYAEIFKTYKAVHDALAPIYRERNK